MASFQFLNSWSPSYRKLFLFLGSVFIVVFLGAVVSFVLHPWPVFSWQQLQELQPQELSLYAFERGNLEFTLTTENYLLFERWLGNTLQPNLVALDIYFFLFGLGLAALLAIVSALPRYWFYIGAMLMAFLIAIFRWDVLQLGGSDSQFPGLIIISVFLGSLFFFQFYQSSTSIIRRFLVFTGLCTLVAGVVFLTSTAPQPLRFLAVNTLPASLILLVIFIILVAHQIMASFVSLALASSRTHSLRQYIIISTIYLLNLWLAYLNRIGYMDWDYTIPSFLLFAVSAALTVWTIRQRAPIYDSLFKSEVLLIYFILAFGTMAFATMGYFISSANDIVLLSLSDLILYAHIGYGMMFLLYAASNFMGMFEKNLPIPAVLYKPMTMPYFSYRFAGVIVMLALVLYNNWSSHINHFTSGYYTALGDIHYGEPNASSFNYFRRAHIYAPYNQHAATALATLEAANGNYGKEKNYSVDANRFQPTEFTILNTDHVYLLSGSAYEDIQLLRKGKNIHTSSGVIRNNLGLAFARVGMTDSAEYYFTEARKDRRTRNSAEMNLIGLIAKIEGPTNADSVYQLLGSGPPSVMSNAFALANRQGKILDARIDVPSDSLLNLFSASLLANYLTNQTNRIDTTFLTTCIRIAQKDENLSFRHMILQAAAKASYAAGQVNRAFLLMQEAIFLGSNVGANNYALGLMAMDQDNHDVALSYFLYALNNKSAPASLANAVSLAEEGRIDEALVAWDTLSNRKDTTLHALGESMKRVLGAPISWFPDLSERERLYYALYRIPLDDSLLFNRLVTQIKNEDLRAKAFLNRAKKYFAADELILSSRQYAHIQGLHLTDTRLFADIKYFELRLMAAQRRITDLQTIIQQGILFGPYRESERVYYEALKQEAAGDTTAARSFAWLSRNNWYFDDGIVAAARYFNRNSRKSYAILADALQVNPRSIKILKAYILVALARGFDPYAVNALETLRGILAPAAFRKYVNENQLSGLLLQ